jgi:hypothetical protein
MEGFAYSGFAFDRGWLALCVKSIGRGMRSGGSMEQPKLAKQCILPGDRLRMQESGSAREIQDIFVKKLIQRIC